MPKTGSVYPPTLLKISTTITLCLYLGAITEDTIQYVFSIDLKDYSGMVIGLTVSQFIVFSILIYRMNASDRG